MATENLGEKMGEMKIDPKAPPAEETEKFEDSSDSPVEVAHDNVMEELKSDTPKLHHVETADTTDPTPGDSTEGDVVKAEVPVAFVEELKGESPSPKTDAVETVSEDTGAEGGASAPATREMPVTVTHENVDTPSKTSKVGAIEDKISEKVHKVVGKESS